ncbi:MAG TPA: class I SAM-dependent methyltransferase [Trinickia sp.]|jgi:SAM-dependent methyltransferase|nr:class I SAM-dependent methyltransferase [Trinickia sp.]
MPAHAPTVVGDTVGAPSGWVVRWSHFVEPGRAVLDVAAGGGRHARWFAARGHPVVAIERDEAALAVLAGVPGVDAVAADLEDGSPWPLAGDRRFAAVVVTNYLHRPLLPRLIESLAPGGVLLYETFARGNETVGKPSNPAFLLGAGELLDAVRGKLRVIAFEDGFVASPRAAFIQRICAVRESEAPRIGERGAQTPPRYDLGG